MPKELKQSINQTKDVEGQIRSALQSPLKRNKLWIVTESDYDRTVYERFFNDNVVVKPAYDENEQGGCDHTVRIVKHILKSKLTCRIIGIRDADYQYFFPNRFANPQNVYHTDERDIEMMMFKATSVIDGLVKWNAAFSEKIEQVKPMACYLGSIRIWHVAKGINASIKRIKLTMVWDFARIPQSPKPGWKKLLIDRYNKLTGEALNPKLLSTFKKRKGLDDMQYGRICRGHDFVQLLGVAMIDSRYSSKLIPRRMGDCYSKEDFASTNLAQNIRTFADGFGMLVM